MRPRRFRRGTCALSSSDVANTSGFNEAPAISPGNRGEINTTKEKPSCFNEAPAISPGNLGPAGRASVRRQGFNEAPAISPGNAPVRII